MNGVTVFSILEFYNLKQEKTYENLENSNKME